MALSGNIERKVAGGSSGGYYIGVDWKINSQQNNPPKSNITATVYVRSSGSGYTISSSATKNIYVIINGTKYTGTNTIGIGTNTRKNLLTQTVDVPHNSDGSKTCAFEGMVQFGFSLSGTSLGNELVNGDGVFDKINVNSAPVMSGAIGVSPSGTIAENVGNLTLSWSKATDADNNADKYQIYRYINGTHNKTFNISDINTLTYNDTEIGSFGEGTKIDYTMWAGDSFGVWSNAIFSYQVVKNTLTGATLASTSEITSAFSNLKFTWGGASNSNSNGEFTYDLTADGITIYNASNITTTSLDVAIVDTSALGPYIKKADIINKYKGTNFSGSLSFILKTNNKYGSSKSSTKVLNVELKAEPTAASPIISEDPALSTALKTVASTKNKYFIPNGTDKIRITWSGGSDNLGQPLSYDVYIKIGNGGYEEKKLNETGNYYDLILPKQTTSQQIVARVITKTSYGYSKSSDAPAKTLHYYNAPSVDTVKIDRTDTTATGTIRLKANTSIPNINFPTRSYAGASSGTLENKITDQTITATNLLGDKKYSWTITVNDDTGFTTVNQTRTIEIPAYTPLFSVREKGVGVNAIPNGEAALMVKGGVKIDGGTAYHTLNKPTASDVGARPSTWMPTANDVGAIPKTGGGITGALTMPGSSQQWIGGAKGTGCMLNMTSIDGYSPMIRQKTTGGAWTFGAYLQDNYYLSFMRDEDINSGNNVVHTQFKFNPIGKFTNVLGTDDNGVFSRNKLTLDTGSALAQDGLFIKGSGGPVMNLWAGTGGAVIMTTGDHNLHLGRNNSTTDVILYDYNTTFNKPINATQTTYCDSYQYQSSSGWSGTWGIGYQCHIMPTVGERFCGTGSYRWQGCYLKTNPNVSSDKSLKENIRYVEEYPKLRGLTADTITSIELHNFIKNDLKIATYDYKISPTTLDLSQEEQEDIKSMYHKQIGFIAQDIVDTKVGSKIVVEDSAGLLSYETGNYTTVIAGALQEEIRLRERENEELKARIKILEEKLGL